MTSHKPLLNIIQAIEDPNILGDTLSVAQKAALKACYGLPMTEEETTITQQCTGKAFQPGMEYREAAIVCGRRGGKSDKLAANVAIYEAFFREHRLSAGETGIVLLLAQNMRQAKVVKGYIEGKIERSPILRRHVVATRAQELELDNGITIAIHPSSFRSIRGLSVVCCICDEIAFWWTEDTYANPDTEVVRAVRPAMATFEHAKLVLVSSPYAMSGVLWEMWQARDEDPHILVWHAPTALMNPSVPKSYLEREKRRDPENFEREYEATFTETISSFLPAAVIDACVVRGRTGTNPERSGCLCYGAIDAAFKGDRFTFCIAHYDRSKSRIVTIDHLHGWQGTRREPVKLQDVMPYIKEMFDRCGAYRVYCDQYGAAPISEMFKAHGVPVKEIPFTTQSKADIYGTLRTLLVDRRIELLDHPESLKELRQLEVELMPGGLVRVGHPTRAGAHDDYADVIALAAYTLVSAKVPGIV